MSSFYYDEDLALVYKISPVVASVVDTENKGVPAAILVHADIKVTNFKREKVRRTLSEVYPYNEYSLEAAKQAFVDSVLRQVLGNAIVISQEEYDSLKVRLEPTPYSS